MQSFNKNPKGCIFTENSILTPKLYLLYLGSIKGNNQMKGSENSMLELKLKMNEKR